MHEPKWNSVLRSMTGVAVVAFAGDAAAQDGAIDAGLISSLSGPMGGQGREYANGLKLAVDQVNEAGGIAALGGRKIRLNLTDDISVPAVSRTLAIKLISNNGASLACRRATAELLPAVPEMGRNPVAGADQGSRCQDAEAMEAVATRVRFPVGPEPANLAPIRSWNAVHPGNAGEICACTENGVKSD
jgi:hypothetical protein